MRALPALAAVYLLLPACHAPAAEAAKPQGAAASPAPPNVLFISVDDLNDWIEPLGGHPQARTPNLTRLAREGVNFTRSYCASPGCNPSRTALMCGLHCYTTGMYSNYQVWREVLPDAVTLPRYLSDHGYWSGRAGKIFHHPMPDPRSWDAAFPSKTRSLPAYYRPKPRPEHRTARGGTVNMPPFENMYLSFDWSPIPIPDEETGDGKSVAWVIDKLRQEHGKPFFLACGIYRPHVPWYVPQKYFDMFPLDRVQLPKTRPDDLADLGERAREIAARAGNYHKHVVAAGQWRQAVQGYLASIAYADAMVGRLLDALEQSPHAHNTIVVLWSDHGWQLGEKQHWRKFALWENLARTVLMIKVPKGTRGLPGGTRPGTTCARTVSLVDLFPTLLELCGVPQKKGLDGRSLVPLLENPKAPWPHPAITTYSWGEFSVRTERWRYIRYIDDSEELYDHGEDPEEWTNLAADPRFHAVKKRMRSLLPKDPAPLVKTSYKLMPHHIPPFASKEDWLVWRRR